MAKHIVYLSTGEILEYTGGRSKFRRLLEQHIQLSQLLEPKPIRCWFRPCDAWRKASNDYMENWKKQHRSLWWR